MKYLFDDLPPTEDDETPETTNREQANRGIATRMADSKRVYRQTRDHRQAILAYCQGNQWLMENARAVGNLPPGY